MSQRKELIGQEYPKERKNPRQKLADTVSCPTALVAIVTFLSPSCCSDKFPPISENTLVKHILSINTV